MKVCVDANVLISYLLNPTTTRPVGQVVRRCFAPDIDLLLNETTLIEVSRSISSKPYLSQRITQEDITYFFSVIRTIATLTPELTMPIPPVSRDTHDDYLIAHSIIEDVDFLVSGDKDLLALGSVMSVRIVSPADFVLFLDARRD